MMRMMRNTPDATPLGSPRLWTTEALAAALVVLCLLAPRRSFGEAQVIVDDQDGAPGFTITGDDWATWGTLGLGYDASDTSFHYLSHTVGGSDRRGTATWSPDLPCDGNYQISTWFRMTENRTHDADHVVHDGHGGSTAIVIDQYGDGASGWVPLGEHFCLAGPGGCTVVLDGTDDDHSDEANATRFVLLGCEGDPDDAVPACDDAPAPGTHEVTVFASTAWTSGDWTDAALAAGAADGREAQIGNLDEGEHLYGGGWEVCNPPGEETILRVEIACRGRTQYASGPYDVLVELSAEGDSADQWHHTELAWDSVEVTGDRARWSWFDVNLLTARVGLHSHPGGARDSDVWVDAFRLRVTYESHEPPDEADGGPTTDPDGGVGDADLDGSHAEDGGASDGDPADANVEADADADAESPADADEATGEDEAETSSAPGLAGGCRVAPFGPTPGPGAGFMALLVMMVLRCRRSRRF